MEIKRIKNIEVTTSIGDSPELPEKVEVELNNGITADIDVIWDSVSADQFNTSGTFTIEGKMKQKEYPSPFIQQRADPYMYKHIDVDPDAFIYTCTSTYARGVWGSANAPRLFSVSFFRPLAKIIKKTTHKICAQALFF